MKYIIVASVLITICSAQNYTESLLTGSEKTQIQSVVFLAGLSCFKDHPLTLTDALAIKNRTVPDNMNAKCFTACVFQKTGFMDDKGNVTPDTALSNAKKIVKEDNTANTIKTVLDKCAESVNNQQVSDDNKDCERAKLAFECFHSTAEMYGVDFDY